MSDQDATDRAREIYRTVRLLKAKLARRHAQMREQGVAAAFHELTMPQCNVLGVVREQGVVTVKELARALDVSPPSASAMVDRLVDMGMVLREQSQSDRREVQIRTSPEGREAIDAIETEMLGAIEEMLDQVGPDTAEQWCRVYARIREILEAEVNLKRETGNEAEAKAKANL